MKVLLTGASGFVGSHVVGLLEDCIPFDVNDRWDDMPPVDVVISLAASANPREALRNPQGAYANGTRVMVDTMEYARRVGARVLHVSTNEVYGPKVGLPYEPRGPYAGAKACQEIVCETYRDVPVTVVVTQSLFGERQQPDKLVPTVVRNLLAGEPVGLQRHGKRWASRPFLHVRNLAEALLFLVEDEREHRRVHVGVDHVFPVRDVANVLANALGCGLTVVPVEAGDRAGHELDVEPIGYDVEGWQPSYQTIPALQDVARWYRDNPEWLEPYALASAGATHPSPPREARRAA